jgi:folate-binding protein YgfZ
LWDAYLKLESPDTALILHPICQKQRVLEHLSRYAPFSRITLTQRDTPMVASPSSAPGPWRLPNMPFELEEADTWSQDLQDWHQAEVVCGIPRIRSPQSGKWTPFMLDMDKLDALSFQKGCYLGQEITHRTHHLGQSKKGLYRGYEPSCAEMLISIDATPQSPGLYVLPHADGDKFPSLSRAFN